MFPDLEPIMRLAIFAIGFVPALLVAAVVSIFVPVPLWGAVLGGLVAGFGLNLLIR